jgi:hypothetical protein
VASAALLPTHQLPAATTTATHAAAAASSQANPFSTAWPLAVACIQLMRGLHGAFTPRSIASACASQQQPDHATPSTQPAALQAFVQQLGTPEQFDAAAAALAVLRLLLLRKRSTSQPWSSDPSWSGAEQLMGRVQQELLLPLQGCVSDAQPEAPWPQQALPPTIDPAAAAAGVANAAAGQEQRSAPVPELGAGVERALALCRLGDAVVAVLELV